jgi:hypothetical protein
MGGHTQMAHTAAEVGGARRSRSGLALLLAAVLATASISAIGAVGAPAGAAVLAKSGKSTKSGALLVEAPGVTVLKKGNKKFVKGKNKLKIKAGDTVQTDATGFAQIEFPDGTITRLDNNTVFTLDKLSTKTGARQVEGTVDVGQTWNRVQKLSENEQFQQGNGNGATAAVLGTAFVTKCNLPEGGAAFKVVKTKKALKKLKKKAKNCNFTLIDGKLKLSALNKVLDVNRGQGVDTTGGDAGDALTVPPDIFFTNAWIARNLAADEAAGIAEATGTPTAEDLKQARIEGSWPVTLTVTANQGFRNLAGTLNRTYTFTGDCGGGGGCQVTLTRQTANGDRVIPLSYNDGVYTGVDPDLGTQDCLLDDGNVSVPGGLKNSGTITFTPSSASAKGGLWIANGLSGTVTESATQVAGGAGQCETGTATFDLTGSR